MEPRLSSDKVRKLLQRADLDDLRVKLLLLMLLAGALCAVVWLVYATGGIKYVYSHSMYLVIISAALLFGVRGGLVFALLGGLGLGPYMPIDTDTGELQETFNWLYRLGFFIGVGLLCGAFADVIKNTIRQFRWRLKHDDQSGLPNRSALVEDLADKLRRDSEGRYHWLFLVYLRDLHEFELRLGSGLSERVVRQVSHRMLASGDPVFRVYHTRSNHLALLLESDTQDVFRAFDVTLHGIMSEPCDFEDVPLILQYSCGSIAVPSSVGYEQGMREAESLLRKVEVCVSHAASRRLHRLHYTKGLEQQSKRNIELLGQFKAAIDEGHLLLHYQPKYDLSTRTIEGIEALVRWQCPRRGFISPADFIPVVEGSQLIHLLTEWVLKRALSEFKELGLEGLPGGRVAVNVSGYNLLNPYFVNEVSEILKQTGLPASALELEITESALMEDFHHCARQLHELNELGVAVSLDDFGTGYCSLQYLDQLPFSIVKLDKFFVQELAAKPKRQQIVSATVQLTHQMGARLLAEGIEDQATESLLQEMGCDSGQGFHFSRPLPMTELCGVMSRAQA